MQDDRNPDHSDEARPAMLRWCFRLYIAGDSRIGEVARANLTALCDTFLAGNYALEVVDVSLEANSAEKAKLFAIPTAIRISPEPVIKVIGDMSDKSLLLAGLESPPEAQRAGDSKESGPWIP